MNTSGSLFSQILSLFNRTDFHSYVRAIKCEYRAKGFTCWEQFVAMMFCELALITNDLPEVNFWMAESSVWVKLSGSFSPSETSELK